MVGPLGCIETMVTIYQFTLRKIPEEHISFTPRQKQRQVLEHFVLILSKL
jgi:hypothetical protein